MFIVSLNIEDNATVARIISAIEKFTRQENHEITNQRLISLENETVVVFRRWFGLSDRVLSWTFGKSLGLAVTQDKTINSVSDRLLNTPR